MLPKGCLCCTCVFAPHSGNVNIAWLWGNHLGIRLATKTWLAGVWAVQNKGTLWLVFFISFPHGGELGKRLTAAQSQGRAFQHELGWGDLQGHDACFHQESSRRHLVVPGKRLGQRSGKGGLPAGRRVAALESTGSCLIFLPHSLKVNRGKWRWCQQTKKHMDWSPSCNPYCREWWWWLCIGLAKNMCCFMPCI